MRRAAVGLVIAIVLLTGSAQAGQMQIPPAAPVAPSVLPDSLEVPFAFSGPQPPVLPATVSRDDFGRATLRAVRLAQPLRLDGRLDEAVYSTVEPISEFIQNEPQAGAPATEKTDVWATFDNDHVYAAHEKPRKSGRTSIGTAGGIMPAIVEISACAQPRVCDRTPLPSQ